MAPVSDSNLGDALVAEATGEPSSSNDSRVPYDFLRKESFERPSWNLLLEINGMLATIGCKAIATRADRLGEYCYWTSVVLLV